MSTRPIHRFFFLGAALALILPFTAEPVRACGERHPEPPVSVPLQGEIEALLKVGTDAAIGEVGRWLPPIEWPAVAIHSMLLPTGKVLAYSYPEDGGSDSAAFTWDPVSGTLSPTDVDTDIFCSGHSWLADGTLYVTGGNDTQCLFQGRRVTHSFDPFDETWTELDPMAVGRWYPTNLTLGDGRVLIFSGLDRGCGLTEVAELYTPGVGVERLSPASRALELYPRLHLLSDGRVAHVGPESWSHALLPATGTWASVGFTLAGNRWSGSSVLVPGRRDEVMILGGYDDFGNPRSSVERIDLASPSPSWRYTAPMQVGRAHANAVLLPDRKVLVIGGGRFDFYQQPIRAAELYDPDLEQWRLLPAQRYGRMYHATALLLPDGRVLSAGQDDGPGGTTAEIYEPPYLFRGPRPTILGAPDTLRYGDRFVIHTPDAGAIGSVALMALSTVTHSVDNSQRYVDLEFVAPVSDRLLTRAPVDGNAAPPGPYMLFIVDRDGIPSEAAILRLAP